MFLRMKSAVVSQAKNRSFILQPDDLVDWRGEKEAKRLVARNMAEVIAGEKEVKEMGRTLGKVPVTIQADAEFERRLDEDGKTREDKELEAYYERRENAVRESQRIQTAMRGVVGVTAMNEMPSGR